MGWVGLGLLGLLLAADAGAPPPAAPARPALPFSLQPRPATSPPVHFPLERRRDGGYRHAGRRFTAEVAPDGTVTFEHTRRAGDLAYAFLPLLPFPHPPGTVTLEGKVREVLSGGRRKLPSRAPDPPPRPSANFPANQHDPGAVPLGYPHALVPVLGLGVVTQELVNAFLPQVHGPDKEERARFLAATFELRMTMAHRSADQQALASAAQMERHLEAVWADRRRAPVERRALACALWAEIDLARPGGNAAEQALLAFIRRRAPAGSPEAYPTSELSACPGRPDGSRFSPYSR